MFAAEQAQDCLKVLLFFCQTALDMQLNANVWRNCAYKTKVTQMDSHSFVPAD